MTLTTYISLLYISLLYISLLYISLLSTRFCANLVYSMDTCPSVIFHRRSDMDDLVFTGSLIEEMKQLHMRAECFSLCHWRKLCNLVLYNPLTRKCRLHTEAFGPLSDSTVETGWQYYGISCANFRLDNAHADVDIINTAPKDVCHSNIIVADDNTSSCYTGASWDVVPVKCVSCYIGLPRKYAYPFAGHSEDVNFDLAAGMKLKLEVSGDRTGYHYVLIVSQAEDYVYLLSLRWNTTPTLAIFNTRQGGVFGVEEVLYGVSVRNISNYNIQIHINESTFETYIDGDLWMSNQMRLPFTDVRRVNVEGFTELRSFRIGYEMC
ncbi:uncharacterized protein [Haliotis asinina]|uniref:uncharacterized protein n=1 Tax=Haliotis asinina TaxID=109174 RepID=UPI0035323D18